MNFLDNERPQLTVCADVAVNSSADINITGHLTNNTAKEIYVFSVLRSLDENSQWQRDDEAAYRFVIGKRLIILLGIPPLPVSFSVFAKIVPYAKKVLPGESLPLDLNFPGVVSEYNPYFTDPEGARFEVVEVEGVELLVDALTYREGLRTLEAKGVLGAVQIYSPEMMRFVQRYRTNQAIPRSQVLKRTDEFERLRPG